MSKPCPICPVAYLPHYDFRRDKHFQELIEGLKPKWVEFAKALCLLNGNRAAAARMVQPDLTPDSAKSTGQRLWNREDIQALYEYLSGLEDPDSQPVSMHEIVRSLESAFRRSNDAKTLMALSDRIIKLRKLSADSLSGGARGDRIEEIDKILAEIQASGEDE